MRRFLIPVSAACLLWIGLLSAWTPSAAAAIRPESLLAHDSVIYLRFDGFDPNRQAYDKTVLSKAMKEDLGPLVDYLTKAVVNALGPDVVAEKLLDGTAPEDLIHLQASAKQLPVLLDYLNAHGVLFGLEVVPGIAIPDVQATLVFPEGGKDSFRKAVFGSIRLLAIHNRSRVSVSKNSGREVLQFTIGRPVQLRCWQEGPHMVCTIGTMDIKHTIALAEGGKRKSLLASPRLHQLEEFKSYPTYAHGFVDFRHALAVTRTIVPPSGKVIDQMGVGGLDQIAFHLGYEDKYQRSTITLNTRQRKGALKLLSTTSAVRWDQLPALPPDTTTVLAGRVELGTVMKTARQTIEDVIQVVEPSELDDFRRGVKELNGFFGIDFQRDLLDALGPTTLIYTSPGEGPFIFGAGAVFEAKDPKKLDKTLRTLVRTLKNIDGQPVSVRRSAFHGTPVYTLHVEGGEFPFTPAAAVHDGWLVVGMFPQIIQGFILRQEGKISTLKPSPLLRETMRKHAAGEGTRIVGFSQSDPRPTVKQLLSIAPLVGSLVRGNVAALKDFDVGLIPNGQSLTEKLSPNVGLVIDDGRSLRFESYSTLGTPIDVAGIEAYYLVFAILAFNF